LKDIFKRHVYPIRFQKKSLNKASATLRATEIRLFNLETCDFVGSSVKKINRFALSYLPPPCHEHFHH